jgi:hypothetical protein
MPARLPTTYRVNRRQNGAVVMPPGVLGENTDRLGHRYDIHGSRFYGVNAPPTNGARECARRRRQMARQALMRESFPDAIVRVEKKIADVWSVPAAALSRDGYVTVVVGDPDAIYIDGERHVTCEAEPRPLAVERETEIVASVDARLRAEESSQPGMRTRKPLTDEQKARKAEADRARRAKQRETVA